MAGAFVPQNEMERVLVVAAEARGADGTNKQFHQELMKAEDIYVPVRADDLDGNGNLVGGLTLHALTLDIEAGRPDPTGQADGKGYIPFFTSRQRVQDFINQDGSKQEIRYVAAQPIPPRQFLEMTQGRPPEIELVVNLGSPYLKTITKAESASLLDGTYLAAGDGSHAITGQLVLGKPNPHPELLLATLAEHFKNVEELQAAYVTQWYNSDESLPHLVIALDAVHGAQPKELLPKVQKGTRALCDKFTKEMVIDFADNSLFRSRVDNFDEEVVSFVPFYKKAAQ